LFDEAKTREQKAAICKLWDEHLYSAHRRQWEFQQAKREPVAARFAKECRQQDLREPGERTSEQS